MRLILAALLAILFCAPASAQAPCCGGYNLGASYTGQVATRSNIPLFNNTTDRELMSRTMHYARQSLTSFKIVIPNFYKSFNGTDNGQGGSQGTFPAATVTAGIEYPLGTCTQVTFSGSPSGSIPSGTSLLASDAMNVTIPNGALFAIRIYFTGTSGVVYNNFAGVQNFGDNGVAGVSGVTDQTTSCTAIAGTLGSGNNLGVIFPAAIIATTTQPSICMMGDSILATNTPNFDGQGSFGMLAPTIGEAFGYITIAQGETQAQAWVSGNTEGQKLFNYCSNLFDELGINDVANGQSSTQLEANLQSIYTNQWAARAQSPATIERTTLTPHTSSTDEWSTTVNQSTETGESARVQFNSDVRNGTFYTGLYSDINAVLGVGTNYEYWNNPVSSPGCGYPIDPNTPYIGGRHWTFDGTHPDGCGAHGLLTSGIINLNHFHR